jgi:hypothetical protein
VIFPSTADDTLQQYVCLTLVVELPPGYPDVAPVVSLRNPRGLDDSVLGRIDREVKEKCESYCGQAVIYELVEVCLPIERYNHKHKCGFIYFMICLHFTAILISALCME